MASVKERFARMVDRGSVKDAGELGLLYKGNHFFFAKILGGPRPSSAPTKLRQCSRVQGLEIQKISKGKLQGIKPLLHALF
jgi:hypothetical protein